MWLDRLRRACAGGLGDGTLHLVVKQFDSLEDMLRVWFGGLCHQPVEFGQALIGIIEVEQTAPGRVRRQDQCKRLARAFPAIQHITGKTLCRCGIDEWCDQDQQRQHHHNCGQARHIEAWQFEASEQLLQPGKSEPRARRRSTFDHRVAGALRLHLHRQLLDVLSASRQPGLHLWWQRRLCLLANSAGYTQQRLQLSSFIGVFCQAFLDTFPIKQPVESFIKRM